jgi:hypothetical protein
MKPEIELSVRVTDGSFEARLAMPIECSSTQRDGIVKSWLEALKTAVELYAIEKESPQ